MTVPDTSVPSTSVPSTPKPIPTTGGGDLSDTSTCSAPFRWIAADVGDLTGRTAVITGASSGLGALVAERMAESGASVVLAVRDVAKGERVRAAWSETAQHRAEVRRLDVADLDSVRAFAAALIEKQSSLDVLVLNAGIANVPRRVSPQGFESQLATNVLGHFALTGLLLPLLERGHDPGVVAVTSGYYDRKSAALDFDDLMGERRYSPFAAYVKSKRANALIAVELGRRLAVSGSPVRSLLAHPGMAVTPLQDATNSPAERLLLRVLQSRYARPASEGMLPLLYAATAPAAPAGRLIGPAGPRRAAEITTGPIAAPGRDPATAYRLWAAAEDLTGGEHLDSLAPTLSTQVVVRRAGGPEALLVESVTTPQPGPREVLIGTEAAGVGYVDVMIRRGIHPSRPPVVPGFDVVGHIVAVGEQVSDLQVGSRVAALIGTGGYATHVLAPAARTAPVPEGLDAAALDALVLNYLTAWGLLHRAARVQAGQSVLVLGAAGGVGSALTELAGLAGVRVYGTASHHRRAVLEARGVTVVDGPEALAEPVDAVFDAVGGASLLASRRAAKPHGVVVSYGLSSAVTSGRSRVRSFLSHATTLIRLTLTPGPSVAVFTVERAARDTEEYRADIARLADLFAQGALHPQVTTLPLTEAAEAHRRLENREVVGKIVLVPA